MKKTGFTVSMKSILDLGNNVAIGMCMDSKYTPFSCLSFPSERIEEAVLEERLKILLQADTELMNNITGYFYDNDYCFLVQSKQDAMAQIDTFWSNMVAYVNNPGMEMYKDLSIQFCYSLAFILGFLNEKGIPAPSNAYTLATFRNDNGQMIPCFSGIGIPEIFGETADCQTCYESFHKKMDPSASSIPSYQDILVNPSVIGGTNKNLQGIKKLCGKKEAKQGPKGKAKAEASETKSDEKEKSKWYVDGANVVSQGVKTLGKKVRLDMSSSAQGVNLCISMPQERIKEETICQRLDALDGNANGTVNKVTGYFVQDRRLVLVQENSEALCGMSEFWDGIKENIGNLGMEEYRDHAMRFCYSLAYVLAKLEEMKVGTSKIVPAYRLATYVGDYVPCFTCLYFPEAFGEVNGVEENQAYFERFCEIMMPYMESIPSYQDVVRGTVLLPGSEEQRNDIVAMCGGDVDALTGDVVPTTCEKEESSSSSSSSSSADEIKENTCEKSPDDSDYWKWETCEESILTDPCFKQDGEAVHPKSLDIGRYILPNRCFHRGKTEFAPKYDDDGDDEMIIRSLGSEFQGGSIVQQWCMCHRVPNDPVSIRREKEVIETVNSSLIPICVQQKDNAFVYIIGPKRYKQDDYFYNNTRGGTAPFVMGFLSLLHDLHESGFLYLRWDPRNIFKMHSEPMYVIGFDTCMKIGDSECTSEMVDWDDEPSEATDLICIGSLLYWLMTDGKLLFGDDKESNKAKFKAGIKISEDEIYVEWMRRVVEKLVSPDVEVRKSVDWWNMFEDWRVSNDRVEIPVLGEYVIGRDTNLYSNIGLFGISGNMVYGRVCDELADFSVKNSEIIYRTEYKGCSCDVCIRDSELSFSMSGSSSFGLSYNNGRVWLTSSVDNKETEIVWSEKGIEIAFPDYSVGIRSDGTVIFPNGDAKNVIEDGNMVLRGQGLTVTHYGSAIEFDNGRCSFKAINRHKWEIRSQMADIVYSPKEFFAHTPFGWLKYRDSRIETCFRGNHLLFNDDGMQCKNSMFEMTSNTEGKARFRVFDKELITNLENNVLEITWFDLPEPSLPPIPMQSPGSQAAPEEADPDEPVKKPTIAEERVIDKGPYFRGIWRGNFEVLYNEMKSQKPKIVIEVPEDPKSAKKKEKKKEKEQDQSPPPDPDPEPKVPVIEEPVAVEKISKEELGTDFAIIQATAKIQKLLERGESIAYVCEVTQTMFLKPKRTRKMVITTAGRVFYTNIGGDGILSEISLRKNSKVSVKGNKLEIRASNRSFHFLMDDSTTLVKKLRECISCAEM